MSFLSRTFIAIGNPIIFWLYILGGADGTFGSNAIEIFGCKTFYEVSTNEYRINLFLFAIFAVIVYSVWLRLQIFIIGLFRNIDAQRFSHRRLIINFIINIGGYFNLLMWIGGVEGNVFVVLGITLIIATLISVIQNIAEICRGMDGAYDKKQTNQQNSPPSFG